MRVQMLFSARTLIALFGVLAPIAVFSGGSAKGNHLLTAVEKSSIRAADGNPDTVCYYINSYYCNALNGTGGDSVTACGSATYPNCSGDCTNACNASATLSWACHEAENGPYGSCPNFPKNNGISCGVQSVGASCVGGTQSGLGFACYCTDGTPGMNPCGDANKKPTPLPGACG